MSDKNERPECPGCKKGLPFSRGNPKVHLEYGMIAVICLDNETSEERAAREERERAGREAADAALREEQERFDRMVLASLKRLGVRFVLE